MKYTYAYKTSDGVRHEAAIEAASREEVFSTLRRQGVKPIKVVASDGSKANGEIRGVRKRVVAAIALAAALVVGIAAFFWGESKNQPVPAARPTSAPRHQIYGDPVIMEDFERGRFDHVLTNRVDQMLAWFAQPGKLMCPQGTDLPRSADAFVSACQRGQTPVVGFQWWGCLTISPADSREVAELKQIVNGLHDELRDYLANGNGTPRSYWRRLLERTQQEAQIYDRTKRELESEKRTTVWEQKNDALRRLGLLTIPTPKDLD